MPDSSVTTPSPSGRQLYLKAGPYTAFVTEVGAGLRELRYEGAEIIDGYPADSMAEGCRGQVLAPWPNRLRDGRWWWKGVEQLVPVDDPAKGNSASHGLVRWSPWGLVEQQNDSVMLAMRLHPRPGYPFTLDFTAAYALGDDGLAVELTVRNPADEDAPVALGMHPYLRPLGGGPIDGARLTLPASARVLVDDYGQPQGVEDVHGGEFDFRRPGLLGDLAINHAFTDIEHGADGLAVVALEDQSGTVTLWADRSTRWIQVFTGDTLVEPERRRGIAIEPTTAPAGALATGTGLTALRSGESTRLRWGVSARRTALR